MAEMPLHCKGGQGGAVTRSVAETGKSCIVPLMRRQMPESTGRGWRIAILSPAVALLFVITSILPVFEAVASIGPARAMQGIAAADCPMHQSGGKNAPAKTACFCILCVTGGLAASPEGDYIAIPERLFVAANIHFATGVSATHGPEWSANPPTGPPAA